MAVVIVWRSSQTQLLVSEIAGFALVATLVKSEVSDGNATAGDRYVRCCRLQYWRCQSSASCNALGYLMDTIIYVSTTYLLKHRLHVSTQHWVNLRPAAD